MSSLLIKMAQAATEDKTLFAPYIQQYASQKSLSWEEVAEHFQIESEQLAKLALCSRPQSTMLSGGILEVADYVGMERSQLKAFVIEVEGRETATKRQNSNQLKNAIKTQSRRGWSWNFIPMLPKKLGWAWGAVILLTILIGAFLFSSAGAANYATLVVNQGQATVVQTNGRNAESVIVTGDEAMAVNSGDRIMLTADATAQVRLIDGSTIDLDPGTEIDVEELVIDDNNYQVRVKVLAGRTLNRVVTVLGVGDRFDVSTPSSTASVRGTVFTVAYISETETYISCDEGKVEVTLNGQEPKIVAAGMEVTAVVGQPLNVIPQHEVEIQPTLEEVPNVVATGPVQEQTEVEVTESTSVLWIPVNNSANDVGPFEHGPSGQVPDQNQSPAGETPIDPPTPIPTPPPPPTPPVGTETTGTDKVTICHKSGTDQQTITISADALDAHLAHGDTLGPCPEDTPEPIESPPPAPEATPAPPGNSGGNGLGGGNNGNGNGNNGSGGKTSK